MATPFPTIIPNSESEDDDIIGDTPTKIKRRRPFGQSSSEEDDKKGKLTPPKAPTKRRTRRRISLLRESSSEDDDVEQATINRESSSEDEQATIPTPKPSDPKIPVIKRTIKRKRPFGHSSSEDEDADEVARKKKRVLSPKLRPVSEEHLSLKEILRRFDSPEMNFDSDSDGPYVEPARKLLDFVFWKKDANRKKVAQIRRLSSSTSDRRYETLPDFLGAGAYGAVYGGRQINVDASSALAIKYPKTPELLIDEVAAMRKLMEGGGHANVVQLLDVCYDSEDPDHTIELPVMERCHYTFRELLLGEDRCAHKGGHPWEARAEICRQLYDGLAFIHRHGIAHGDISLGNILVHAHEGLVKYADFGLTPEDTLPRHFDSDLDSVVGYLMLMWVGREYGDQELEDIAKAFPHYSINDIKIVFKAIYGKRPNYNGPLASPNPVVETWEDIFSLNRSLKFLADDVHRYEMMRPNPRNPKSIPVPYILHKAMKPALRVCERHLQTAAHIHSEMDKAVVQPLREFGVHYIRSLGV